MSTDFRLFSRFSPLFYPIAFRAKQGSVFTPLCKYFNQKCITKCSIRENASPFAVLKTNYLNSSENKRKQSVIITITDCFLAGAQGLVCIFAIGADKGSPPSSRRRQQSTGLLHLDYSSPAPLAKKNSDSKSYRCFSGRGTRT